MADAFASRTCVFCTIVRGESPASVFYKDNSVLGLMTIAPAAPGHGMIIPMTHAAYLREMPEETGQRLWTVTQRSAAAIRASGVRCEGIDLFLADGEASFQHVPHVHMHLILRYNGDGFRLPGERGSPIRAELDRIANQIKAAYAKLYA